MPKIPDSIKEFFSRKSKETETTPEIITMEGNLEKLEKEVGKSAELFEKQGDSKTAKKLKDIARKLKKAPGEAVKELEAFLEKTNLSPKTKQKLQALLERFKRSFKSLLNAISVRKKHNEHVENVVINFYEMVNEILKGFFKICDYEQTTGIISECESNVVILILITMNTSGLDKYASMHKLSVINKWYKYLLKYIKMASEYLDKQVRVLMLKNNREDKGPLLRELCSTQKGLSAALLGVLNLEQYVRNHKIEKSSLGVVVNGDKYKKLFANTKCTLESYMDDSDCEKMCRDLLGLGSASDSEPVESY